MKCQKCRNKIPPERLAVLPHTRTCVVCSTEKPVKGNMVFEKKMASELVIRSADSTDPFKGSTFRK